MKGFKQFIEEDHGRDAKSLGGDGGHGNQYGRWGQEPVHMGVHRIEDPNVLQRLNAHIGLVNTREYIDPRSALEQVQNALMRLGYHFEYNMDQMPNEENVYPLNRFGGRKGFLDMDAVVKEDDGIEKTTGESMVLRVEFLQDPDSSRYEVTAQIVPASLFDDEEVQPDAIRPNRAGVPSTTGDSIGIDIGESRQSDPKKADILRGREMLGLDPSSVRVRKGLASLRGRIDRIKSKKVKTQTNEVSDSAAISGLGAELERRLALVKRNAKAKADKKPQQREKSKQNEQRLETDPKKLAILQSKARVKGMLFRQRNAATQARNDQRARDSARKFAQKSESTVYVSEAVSISDGKAKGSGTFEVTFDFRGGPTQKQAQKFALAAQKRLAGASFTPNRKGNSETVVVTVKASSSRDAQVKARKVLDNVKESVDHITEAETGRPGRGSGRREFPFNDLRTAQKFIRSVDLVALDTFIDNPKSRLPIAVVRFKNDADAAKATKIAKKLGATIREGIVTEAQKFKVGFPTMSDRNAAMKDVKRLPSGLRTTASAFFKGAGPENGVIFIVGDDGLQTRDLMKLIKKNKGIIETNQTFGEMQESLAKAKELQFQSVDPLDEAAMLSRTFAFATADARDRVEKLFGLATGDRTTTTNDKGKGKLKFTVTGMLRGAQIDRIMKSVTQLKGKLAEETNEAREFATKRIKKVGSKFQVQVWSKKAKDFISQGQPWATMAQAQKDAAKFVKNESINESLSRTFAFPSADARNRLEKLLGLASRELVTTTDKGKGKFKFTVTAILQASQISKVMNSVKQLKGIVEEISPKDMANDAVRAAIQERAERLHERDPFSVNEASAFIEAGLKHARDAVGGGKQFVSVSGRMSGKKASQTIRGAAKFLKQHGTPADKKLAAKALGEGTEKRSPKAKATLAKLTKHLTPKQQVAMKLMREGVQIFPAEPRFSGPLAPKPGKFDNPFNVEVGFSSDDWKRLAPLVRKAATKAKWKTFEIRSDKVLRVVLKGKDAKKVQKQVSDLVDGVKKSIGIDERVKGPDARMDRALRKEKRASERGRRASMSDPADVRISSMLGKAGERESHKERTATAARLRTRLSRRRDTSEDCGLSHDENDKELRRLKKDNKLASGLDEASNLFTVVALKGNKVVGQIHSIGKQEIKTAVEVLKKDHPGAKVSVENKSGKVVSVESVEEQLSKKKKKTTSAY